MDEDDTFRLLSRRPYEEVARDYSAFCVSVPSFESRVYFLGRYGWKLSEYEEEFKRDRSHALWLTLVRLEALVDKNVQ